MVTTHGGEVSVSPFGEVGPELYRRNTFRITGLAVDATARDIRRQAEKLRVAARLGVDSGAGPRILPLTPPPDDDVTQQAMQRLRDPIRRLVDEFFWFWPIAQGGPDEAMDALRRGETGTAVRIWRDRPGAGPAARAIAAHNLAVLAHARALDLEGIDSAGRTLWDEAFRHWRAVLSDEVFWELLTARVRELADPRLSPATVRRLRADLPAALLSINARLAVRASHDDRDADILGHLTLMHRSGFAQQAIDDVLRRTVEPDLAQLRTLGERVEQTAAADPRRADEAARRLLDQAAPLLSVLDDVLPEEHTALRGARDEIASRALQCTVLYVNRTSEWRSALELLDRILPIAATESVRARVTQNTEIIRGNLSYGTCWFCKDDPAAAGSAFVQHMHGDVAHLGYQITWHKVAINVPRCAACKTAHRRRTATVWGAGCGTNILVIALAIGMVVIGAGAPAFVLFALGIIGFFVVMGMTGANAGRGGLPPEQHATLPDFAPIREQLDAGWNFGERPPGVN